jgi:hypothetical protein
MPSIAQPNAGTVPGPDVIVGDVSGSQFGSGTQVGSVGTDSCNQGRECTGLLAIMTTRFQNLYRMKAKQRPAFEQIGQFSVKHAFTALANKYLRPWL